MRPAGLSDIEKQVRKEFLEGRRTVFGDPAVDDPAQGASWGPERTLQAAFIRKLIEDAGERRAPLRLVGARVVGALELEYLELGYSLSFSYCSFDDEIDLHDTRLRRLNLRGTHLSGLNAAMAHVDGSVVLSGAHSTGQIRLDNAVIGGGLLLTEAVISHPGGVALRAERVQVTGDLALWDTTIEGTAVLRDARVDGVLSLQRARLRAPGAEALDAARLYVGSDVLADELHSEGRIHFSGAQVAGLLRLAKAKLSNPGTTALDAYQAKIGADLQCYHGFEADGLVRITGARIEGHARFDGAVIHGDGANALDARYADIRGAARCREMRAAGAVRFANARVANDLDFREAILNFGSPSPVSSSRAPGPVSNPVRTSPNLLFLGNLRAAELTLRFAAPPQGGIYLAHAQVGVLNDDPAVWPPSLSLDGFAYERIADPGDVAVRIGWLEREDAGYRPGPYEQLATVYRRQGLDGEARRVLLAKQRARRRNLPTAARPWGFIQDAAVGYGYRPERALGWLAALLITGAVTFGLHHPIASGPDQAPPFNPLIYTLDLLLPVINFGQGRAYIATGGYQWLAYLLTAAGWILATTIAAGVARAVNRA
ncbi:MAG: hypothetical protein JF587_14215 [Catenulisporales bacterium]|nr:hypothetical protein [Catenulisporales bacterium]